MTFDKMGHAERSMQRLHAWVALAALAGLATNGAAVVCPTLPPDPGAELIRINAATYNNTQFQTLAYNGTKWGPLLRLTLGQPYQIDVTNVNISDGTSVHWHGQRLLNASWADGVAPLVQGPTPPGSTFTYRFTAEPAGTYWYHSHTGTQFGDGLRGPLIVEDPNDPLASLYDVDNVGEHLILLADVFPNTLGKQLETLETQGMSMGGGCPYQDISDAPYYAVEVNGESFNTTSAAKVFTVAPGKRYRFRTIAGMSSWGLEVATVGHEISLIAVDGQPIQPTPAKGFRVTPGERVDFVLTADQPVANYWINVTTINGINSPAILHYEGAPDPATDPAVSASAYTMDLTCASGLGGQPGVVDFKNATLMAGAGVPPPPEESTKQFTIYLPNPMNQRPPPTFLAANSMPDSPFGLPAAATASLSDAGMCPSTNGKYCWSINWNVYVEPDTLPIYPATFEPLNASYYIAVEEGDVVDVAFINPTPMVHPMHLHGQSYWVLATGNGDILMPDGTVDPSKVQYNLKNPVLRDNLPVPQTVSATAPAQGAGPATAPDSDGMSSSMGRRLKQMADGMGGDTGAALGSGATTDTTAGKSDGYAVVRFVADNPGVWAFHCHIDLHLAAGMFFYFTVTPPGGEWFAPQNLECA